MKHLLWNIDTQIDFMDKNGKLPVPDADTIKDNLQKITQCASDNFIRVVNTCDRHTAVSKEISKVPDFERTFPQHCIANTNGEKFIEETRPYCGVMINYDQESFDIHEVLDNRNIVIAKDSFDVFAGNPFTEEILKLINPKIIYVYGVAGNICVDFAIMGLVERGYEVWYVADAIKDLPNIPSQREKWLSNSLVKETVTNKLIDVLSL